MFWTQIYTFLAVHVIDKNSAPRFRCNPTNKKNSKFSYVRGLEGRKKEVAGVGLRYTK